MSFENFCTAPFLRTIKTAIAKIDAKKDELKKAFDNRQAHSSHLSSFSISWSNFDSYFASIQDSIIQQFHLLQSANSFHNHAVEGLLVSKLTLRTTQLSKQGDSFAWKLRVDQIDPVFEQPSSSNSVGLLQFGDSTPPPRSSSIDSGYINERVKERDAFRSWGNGFRSWGST
ncbi:hypothetical protein PTKIN_Ptkin11bG0191500 [Pterospermum kingtungense]